MSFSVIEAERAIEVSQGGFTISTDKSRLQIDRIHRFLSTEAYWSLGIPQSVVERAVSSSLCFGVYRSAVTSVDQAGEQVGYARVVSDFATFAWVCDVYIERNVRGQGLSKWLVQTVLAHPALQGLRRVCLATKDAHTLYEQFGFKITETPGNWLEIKDNEIYTRLNKI